MTKNEKAEGMLSPYRILDLTDERGLMCGRVLGDLGADVIKIEKPDGDIARNIGPFYLDEPDPEKSLFWFSFNANKRGITLDIDTADGREIFKKLVKTADAVVESFPPGYMEQIGLGYPVLEKINPRVSLVSITPFGQTGPYRDYNISDIVAWALGGYMYTVGDADRPPVRISYYAQTFLHSGIQAAQGTIMAIYNAEMTGEGQFVDVSIQDSVTRCTPERITHHWDFTKRVARRGGRMGLVSIQRIWPCKDGYVYAIYWSGQYAKRWNSPLVKWMELEGVATEFIKNLDWDTFNMQNMSQELADNISNPTLALFAKYTKQELLEGALKHNVQLYPLSDAKDILNNIQLEARDFWVDVEHPELGTSIRYPGAFAKTTESPPELSRRAPLIGEHNHEIYEDEMGISRETLILLKQAGIV
ncbi:CaiB/BaiF CoA transferase family protein [Chloroflexota bacterium]